jgi:phosphoribosyl 1,2-cyclic phosphodiesterase
VLSGDGRRFIFDAGSGIRLLGENIARTGEAVRADLFLSHFHWDHIQGLPFFAPLYDAETNLRVHGAKQGDTDIQALIAAQMGPVYFPVPFEAVAANLEFRHLGQEPWLDGDVAVRSIRVRHPGWTHGYRIDVGSASIAYFPDCELIGGHYALPQKETYDAIVRFLHGVNVLFHDAMLSDVEYVRREGWGHSSYTQAVQLAEDAGVGRLQLFHHAPERTDEELSRILEELGDDLARRGATLDLGVAIEGEELLVDGAPPSP